MTTVEPREIVTIELSVNGDQVSRSVPARLLLVDFLRDTLDLTGTHVGCEHGICGACTILIDGEPARSCCTLAVQADGCELTTIEGLTPAGGLTEMQEAFRTCHGLQCGFCTPGFIVTLSALDPLEHPDDDAIREAISGNLCRCTGYDGIVRAIKLAWGRTDEAATGRPASERITRTP